MAESVGQENEMCVCVNSLMRVTEDSFDVHIHTVHTIDFLTEFKNFTRES